MFWTLKHCPHQGSRMRRSKRLATRGQGVSTDAIQHELPLKKTKCKSQGVSPDRSQQESTATQTRSETQVASSDTSDQDLSARKKKGKGQGVSSDKSHQGSCTKEPKNKSQGVSVENLTENEDCHICTEQYLSGYQDWRKLDCCKNKICKGCHSKLVTNGTTMSGKRHTFIKCPFCQNCSGIQIGTCPNGTMQMSHLSTHLPGYAKYNTVVIHYTVSKGKYWLNRVAYLPNSSEGIRVYNLLRIAWDRRLCFTIGDSITTGQQDVLVWNLHHKTSTGGGISCYGYPDPTYLERVLDELKQYNIE